MKKIRQPIIAVLGHVDHGKCLMPNERVILPEYGEITLKELFELSKEIIERDEEREIRKLNIQIQTIDGSGRPKIVESPYIWRLKHKGKIIRIKLKNWHHVSVTPEHPFLTNRGWKRADQLKVGDYVAVPRRVEGNESFERFMNFVYSKLLTDELIVKINQEKLR